MDTITSLPMRRAAVTIALQRYGAQVDVEDRIGDALEALVKAAVTFKPRPKQDKPGYAARYALGQVAGAIRHSAQGIKEISDAEIAATDAGVEELFYDGTGHLLGDTRIWVVNGKATAESDLLAQADDPEALQAALDHLAEDNLYAPEMDSKIEPTFVYERDDPRPLFYSDIPDAEAVLKASRTSAPWNSEETETVPWDIRFDEATRERPVNAMARDNYAWPQEVLDAWSNARQAWRHIAKPATILDYMAGEEVSIEDADQAHTITTMENLSDALAEFTDDENYDIIGRSVAKTLAERVVRDGLPMRDGLDIEGLRQAFVDYLGVEPDAWEPTPLPEVKSYRRQYVDPWLKSLNAWPSQKVGIEVLLNGGTPWAARQAEQAWFKNRQR